MAITAQVDLGKCEVTIRIEGRFDFSTHQEFVRSYKEQLKGETKFVVDLGKTDYMDSSAMGMLLQLREHSGNSGGVTLVNSNEGIREILRIANFDKLFPIE